MQQPPPRRGSGQQPAAFTFEAKLQDEEPLLESLLAALGRGVLPDGAWERLHAAAQRDQRMSELAFSFESVSQGKRIKMATPAAGSEFLFQAARFFSEVFGDDLGAITYLERALALAPTHAAAFARLEALLTKTNNGKKLAEVYAAAAHHRPRAEQAPLLKQAAVLLAENGGPDEKVIELLQQASRLEPGDVEIREGLEVLYLKTNRLRDVVRLQEQALATDPPPEAATRRELLVRILDLYADKLHEPERAMPHVEQLLAMEPTNEDARRVAQKLVVIKGLAGRAAAALSQAYEVSGTPQEIARFLAIELESTRGPKRAALLGRLGNLKAERMGDDKGAFEAFEQALAVDGNDDDLRARYVAIAGRMGRWTDAAKALGRVVAMLKDPAAKARASTQLGEVLLRGGDPKRAKSLLAGVLASPETPADATLPAARALREILEGEKDPKALCDVLEKLAVLEPEVEARREADEKLAALATAGNDMARAIAAYERLLSTSARPRALAALAPLYEASGDPLKHARLLEEQARDTADATVARELMMRAAAVRSKDTKDAGAAIASCLAIVERFGAARDVDALLIPLLEGAHRWPELCAALESEATFVTGAEHAAVMSRLGNVRLSRLREPARAIEAYAAALASDGTDKTARLSLEKLASAGDHRLEAARVLEPLYRRDGATPQLVKMLELRGGFSVDADERLSALREAADLAEAPGGSEAARAADIAGKGLTDAVASGKPLGEWLERLERVAKAGTDPKRRAAILVKAMGELPVTSDELGDLARRAADAQATSGDLPGAIAMYRRALAHEPQSTELLSRIDDLLRDQGSPAERIALYRAALEGAGAARRRELLHRIGGIERSDLSDPAAAIATYAQALRDAPDDADAHAALAELTALLEVRLEHVTGDAARSTRATLAELAATHGDETRARTQCARLLEDPHLASEHLDAVERAADRLVDADLARAVLLRRAEMTQDPREQVGWLDRLGELDEQRRGDLESAAAAWKRAGIIAQDAGDDEVARRMFSRARRVAPDDRELTVRLVALCERAELWRELPPLYGALVEQSSDDAERVDLLLRAASVQSTQLGDAQAAARNAELAFGLAPTRAEVLTTFESLSVAAGAVESFERAVDEAVARLEESRTLGGDQRAQLLLARARALASEPQHADDAARVYRAVLSDARADAALHGQALAAFDTLVERDPDSPRRRADRRWLLEWRAEHAPEEERIRRLLDWARAEEEVFSDPVHALALHRRVLALDADSDAALTSVARIALATGDTDDALEALRGRRDRAEGPSRVAIELEIAQVLLSRTTRWQDALDALKPVLHESPGDPSARALASQLLAHRATRSGAIAMLEQACDASDDPAVKEQILTRLLDAPADADESGARRGWFERLCDQLRGRGDDEAALTVVLRATRELPEVPALWDRAEELARVLKRADEVAALYGEVLARSLSREQTLAIGERAVQFYEEWFEDPARVVRILERVLELDPAADWAFDRLKLLLDSAERWDDLFALYDRALDHAAAGKRATLLEEAAQTAKDFADRPDRAIQYLEQLHELRPGDTKLVSSLERLYERQGRHRELVALLAARLPAFKREEARRARTRIAVLWLEELGDPGQALESIEPLLQHPEEGANGAEMDVWALLEAILAASPPLPDPRRSTVPPGSGSSARPRRSRKSEAPPSSRASVRQRTAVWLREHYAQIGRDADLARLLLVELETVRATKERVKRHTQVGELYEKLGDAPNALEQIGAAMVLDPGNEEARGKLVELAESMGRFERLADLLSAAADVSNDAERRVALTMQAAEVRADRIGDAAGAIGLFTSVLEARGARDADVLSAAGRLSPLLEAAGRNEERLVVLERIAAVERSPDGQRQALGRAAHLSLQLGQPGRAIELWERVLAGSAGGEGDLEALDSLVELLDREGKHARLVEVLTIRARAAVTDERRRADRVRVAKLLGETLERLPEAIEAWLAIERDFGEADDAALALATLLRATRGWRDLAELLARRARRTDDEVTRGEFLRQLGDVQREELDAGADAVATYEQALAADPSSAGARAGLLALAGQESHRAAALVVLLKTLRFRDDWRAVLELTPYRLLAARSDTERQQILHEAAELSEIRAGDAGLAFEAMRRAFALAPSDDRTWNETARLAEAAGAWDGLVATYGEAVGGAARSDTALISRLRTAMGHVFETRLDDPKRALDEYLQVVRDARDLSTGGSAVRVAGRLGRWDLAAQVVADLASADVSSVPALLQAYEQAAGSTDGWSAAAKELSEACAHVGLGGAAARDIEAGVARWYRDRLGDNASAETAYLRALAHDAANVELLRALAELQRPRRDRVLVETLLRLSRAVGALAALAGSHALLREAAEVARDSVGDRPLAISILGDLLSLARSVWTEGARAEPGVAAEAPDYARWAVESLAELHAQQGDPGSQVDVLVAGDALPFPAETRQLMRRQAARVSLDGLRDHDRAVRLYLALLDDVPGDAEAVDALASIYRAHGRTADLLILRERQIASGAPPELRLALRLEAAHLLVSLGEAVRAVDSLRESLSEQPWHEATVEALAGVLESEGKLGELRELLGEQAGRAEERGETARAAELWGRAATVALDRQRDTHGAETYHARVVALEPRVGSLNALAKLTSARGDPAAAAAWLERLVEVVPPDARAAATLRLAEALVRSGQVERAAERLEAALVAMPEAEPLRQRLSTLYREQQDWERLGRLVAASAAHAPDKAGRLSRLLEAASLFSERCSRPDLAVPLLEQASDLAQQDPAVRLQLAGALASASRFDEARAILQAMIDAFGGRRPKERAPVHYQIARLELAMGNRARALVELDTATRVDPQNPEILRTLAELARDDGQLERAEKSYRALLVVLRRREEAGDNGGIARSEVLLELSVIANRQGEGDRAREILESALEAAAKSEFEQERLEGSLRARGDDETLVRVLEAKLARLGDSPAGARALTELANVLADRLGRPEQALPARLRAVTLDPGSPAAHEAALGLSRAVGRVDAYLACARTLVDKAVADGDVALAASLLVRLGTIAEEDLADKAQSARLYERALELGVRTPQVLRALDRVYEQLGDADSQARILGMRAEVDAQVDGARAAADSTYRLAALRLSSRKTFDVGVDLLRRALEIDPQLDRVEAVLRKALEIDGSDTGLLDLYEHVGRQPGHERTLIDALRLRAQLPGTDVSTVREAVDLAVRIGDPSLAETLLERFVTGEQSATQNVGNLAWALATLASLKETAGDLKQAVDLKKAAARVAEPETARKLEFEVARLAAEKLDDLALAAETYEALRTRDPADREAWEPLAAVYRRKGDARKLADLLASVVDFVDDVGERSRLRLERVSTLTRDLALGDAEAGPLLREIVDEDPSQVEAALLLAGILERSGAKDDLAELLARQLDAAKDRSDAASIASLALRLGGLLEDTDRMQARNVYYAGLDWEPKSRGLLDALARMLGNDDDPGERADLIERRLTIEEGPTAEPLALQLANLRRELGDEAAAERALELGYRANPASTKLRGHLESTFRDRGLWRKLAELWMLDASSRTDPNERIGRLREAAALYKDALHDAKSASEALRLSLEAAPGDVAILQELVETSLSAGAPESAVHALSAFIERNALPDATRAALLARRSDVRSAMGDEAGALEDVEAAFAIDRTVHAGALGARLARSRENAERAGDVSTERLMRLRAAQVLPYAGKVDEARTILTELVREDPRDKAALKTLASLETALERWDGASAALRRLVALEEDGAAAVETALRLADVCERGGRPGDARGVLERARLVAPQDRSINDRLQRVYEQTGAWHELANLALEDARASGDVAERFSALVRAGALLLEQAGDAAGAMAPLEEARALRPADPACVGPLADAYTLSGRAPEAAALIEQVLAPHKGKRSREIAPLYVRLARAARYVGDEAGELRSMSLALDCDSQNGEVCADVALRAVELEQFELANRALRSVTLLKVPGPMSKALAYQYMGEIARKQGDPKRALMLLKRALTEDPTLEGARALIDVIERGS